MPCSGLGCAGGGGGSLTAGLLDGGTESGSLPPRDGAAADSVADATEAGIDAATDTAVAVIDAEGSADVTENDTQEPASGPCGALGNACCANAGCGGGLSCTSGSRMRDGHQGVQRRMHSDDELLLRRRLQLGGDVPVWFVRLPGGRVVVQWSLQEQLGHALCKLGLWTRRPLRSRSLPLPGRLPALQRGLHSLVGLLHERGLRGGPDLPERNVRMPKGGAALQRCLHPVRRLLHERRLLRG